jgi:acyl-coenzyme A synthetase/AMP-(fatty) acid ligase
MPGHTKPGCAGRPVPGYRLRIIDPDDNKVPAKHPGEMVLQPKAYCVLRHPTKADPQMAQELIQFTKRRLAPFKYPRWVEFLDELPKTASGKVQRFRLRG